MSGIGGLVRHAVFHSFTDCFRNYSRTSGDGGGSRALTWDHYWDRWGATKIVYQPRIATRIDLSLQLTTGGGVRVIGSVSPDIGGEDLDFHVVFPNADPIWVRRPLGPASTFDHVIEGNIAANETAFATAYFDGNDEFASSVSKTASVTFVMAG